MLDGVYYTHFEITGGPCNPIGSNWCDLFTNRTIFCFKSHLFPSQWEGHTKNNTTNQISRLFLKKTIKLQENERKRVSWQILQLLFSKLLFPPPSPHPNEWMNQISNRLSTASIKYLNWPSPVFGQFQNGCYKVVIEARVEQFWSEIVLVILKLRVWFQPKFHFTQFNYHYKSV